MIEIYTGQIRISADLLEVLHPDEAEKLMEIGRRLKARLMEQEERKSQ